MAGRLPRRQYISQDAYCCSIIVHKTHAGNQDGRLQGLVDAPASFTSMTSFGIEHSGSSVLCQIMNAWKAHAGPSNGGQTADITASTRRNQQPRGTYSLISVHFLCFTFHYYNMVILHIRADIALRVVGVDAQQTLAGNAQRLFSTCPTEQSCFATRPLSA